MTQGNWSFGHGCRSGPPDRSSGLLTFCRPPLESTQLTEIHYIASVLNALVFPLIAGVILAIAKLSSGEAARRAERQFLATLVVMTIITLRTVIMCDEVWLVHTATLAIMIVGALIVPSQQQAAVA